MAVSALASGTQTAVIGTEHFLAAAASPGTFTFHVDTNQLASGDTLELRVYQTVLSGGTPRVAYMQSYSGAQPADDTVKTSVPASNELSVANALRFSLKQTAGSGRSFPWKVLTYG